MLLYKRDDNKNDIIFNYIMVNFKMDNIYNNITPLHNNNFCNYMVNSKIN